MEKLTDSREAAAGTPGVQTEGTVRQAGAAAPVKPGKLDTTAYPELSAEELMSLDFAGC
jgi:hypothetical protein